MSGQLFEDNIWAFVKPDDDTEGLPSMNYRITWHLTHHTGQKPGYFWKIKCKEDPDNIIWAKKCEFFVFTKTGANHIECKGFIEQNIEEGIVSFYAKDMKTFYEAIQEKLEDRGSGIVFTDKI